jgi:uroporphyrinogen-III synthase
MHAFITRDLTPDSPFLNRLTTAGWTVTAQSLVQLTPLTIPTIPAADWIFFSSQNGVLFFFDQIKKQGLPVPTTKWAALGKATAAVLLQYIPTADFIGSGDPESAAADFRVLAQGSRVLFPGAQNSRQSIQGVLKEVATVIDLPVYENTPIANAPSSEADMLVFTSPLNVTAYFAGSSRQAHQKIAAIGRSTAAALQEQGISDVWIPHEATEAALADLLLQSF